MYGASLHMMSGTKPYLEWSCPQFPITTCTPHQVQAIMTVERTELIYILKFNNAINAQSIVEISFYRWAIYQ